MTAQRCLEPNLLADFDVDGMYNVMWILKKRNLPEELPQTEKKKEGVLHLSIQFSQSTSRMALGEGAERWNILNIWVC